MRYVAVERIAAAREAGGDELDIIVEIHSTLDANTAVILGKSLEPYRILLSMKSIARISGQITRRQVNMSGLLEMVNIQSMIGRELVRK